MSPKASGEKVVATNRRARRDYEILDSWECGIMLQGSEVKSLRESKVQLADSYARLQGDEVWLIAPAHRSVLRGLDAGRPRVGPGPQAAAAPLRDRRDSITRRPGAAHARSALAVLQGRPGEARARARPWTSAVRQAPGHRQTRRRAGSSPGHGSRQSRRRNRRRAAILTARWPPGGSRRSEQPDGARRARRRRLRRERSRSSARAVSGRPDAAARRPPTPSSPRSPYWSVSVRLASPRSWLDERADRHRRSANQATTRACRRFCCDRSSCRCCATLLLLLFYRPRRRTVPERRRHLNRFRPASSERPRRRTAPADRRQAHVRRTDPDWSVVTGFVLGVAGLALASGRSAQPSRSGRASRTTRRSTTRSRRSLADLDGLDDDPDHRRVVIRTYARMERGPRPRGRRPRAVGDITGVPPSCADQPGCRREPRRGELTDLFEQARFSTHPDRRDDAGRRRGGAPDHPRRHHDRRRPRRARNRETTHRVERAIPGPIPCERAGSARPAPAPRPNHRRPRARRRRARARRSGSVCSTGVASRWLLGALCTVVFARRS